MYEKWLYENGYDISRPYTERELRAINEDLLFEMACIRKKETGLPYDIWLDPMGKDRGNEHTYSPRLKIDVDGKQIPVLINDDPDIPDSVKKINSKNIPNFSKVKKWIVAYKKILIAHFLRQISDASAIKLLSTTGKAEQALTDFDNLTSPKNNGVIEYYWLPNEGIYQIDTKDEDGNIVTTSYAASKYDAWVEIQEMQDIYEIDKENIVFVNKSI